MTSELSFMQLLFQKNRKSFSSFPDKKLAEDFADGLFHLLFTSYEGKYHSATDLLKQYKFLQDNFSALLFELFKSEKEVNRHAEALKFFERAIKLAESNPDSGLPFMAYEGKAQSLVSLGKSNEAKQVLEDALTKARSEQKRGHEAQLLILLGKLAAQTGNTREGIASLEEAGQFATRVQVFRMEADAMFELAKLYRDSGDLDTADARATQGLGRL